MTTEAKPEAVCPKCGAAWLKDHGRWSCFSHERMFRYSTDTTPSMTHPEFTQGRDCMVRQIAQLIAQLSRANAEKEAMAVEMAELRRERDELLDERETVEGAVDEIEQVKEIEISNVEYELASLVAGLRALVEDMREQVERDNNCDVRPGWTTTARLEQYADELTALLPAKGEGE